MKLWRWQKGRQLNTEYWKFPLWYFRIGKFGFDAYILKYKPLTMLEWHTDPVDGKHWRINIKIKGQASFAMRKDGYYKYKFFNPNIILFRPDLWEHRLVAGYKGCTKLSFGFVKFN